MRKVTENAYQQYLRSRPAASSDSNKRIKDLPLATCSVHPLFRNGENSEDGRDDLLDKMRTYRPHGVILILFI